MLGSFAYHLEFIPPWVVWTWWNTLVFAAFTLLDMWPSLRMFRRPR